METLLTTRSQALEPSGKGSSVAYDVGWEPRFRHGIPAPMVELPT